MTAQRYGGPIAHGRMEAGACSLRPDGVRERIAQCRADQAVTP